MQKTLAALALTLATTTVSADTVTINGAELFYESIGSGPPVLMMHGGLGLSHDYLRPYFDQLADTHTVIYYDHFGNGRSDKPEDYAETSFARLVSDADALMTELGHESFTLIGHSYGGFIAQEFAIAHPDRLDGLVLIDTVPAFDYAPQISGPDANMAAFGKLFSQPMADNNDWQATWGLVVELYFADPDPDVLADLDARTVYEYRAWNAAGALLATFNTLEGLPNATLMIFEESAHYPFIEEEAAFFEALDAWLAR
ncbi:MAG: alpha/beta fold hydrolase [Pseudomonadota bacterium]